jgi:hypothetical protein
MCYSSAPIFTTALLRAMISPLDLSNEVSFGTHLATIIVCEFNFTMVEKELQCMTALQNHLRACSSIIYIIIGIVDLFI